MRQAGSAAVPLAVAATVSLAWATVRAIGNGGASARASRPMLEIAFVLALSACLLGVSSLDRTPWTSGRARWAIGIGVAVILLSPLVILVTALRAHAA